MFLYPGTRRIFVSRNEVANFNRFWPCSEMSDLRDYEIEFDVNYNLVDHDIPEHCDGSAASAICDDMRIYLETGDIPAWCIADEKPRENHDWPEWLEARDNIASKPMPKSRVKYSQQSVWQF